jgi:alpha-glucosidase
MDEFPERMTVGEVFGPPDQIAAYYGGDKSDGLHLAFNFPFVRIRDHRWNAAHVRRHVDAFEAALSPASWPNHVFGNHDVDRMISRVNADGRGHERARVAALLLLTLRGTPFVYYGEEIGMENADIREHMLQDPARFFARGRDPERTPMQWALDGGFTAGSPWLPYSNLDCNVADERGDPASLLSLYRRLIWLRRASDALRYGDYAPVDGTPAGVFAYTRTSGADRTLTVLNFTDDEVAIDLPPALHVTETLAGTHGEPPPSQRFTLAGSEGRLFRLS